MPAAGEAGLSAVPTVATVAAESSIRSRLYWGRSLTVVPNCSTRNHLFWGLGSSSNSCILIRNSQNEEARLEVVRNGDSTVSRNVATWQSCRH
jgi:hypothetical protein